MRLMPHMNQSGERSEESGEASPPISLLPSPVSHLHARHCVQKLRIRARLVELLDEQVHRLHGRKRREDFAQGPDAIELVALKQQLLFTRARLVDVDGGEDALVGELAVEVDLEVAGAFEL